MLQKLRLNQTETFARLVGTHEISKMVVSFVKGHSHPIEIGAEQGGIEKWDDFVIKDNLKSLTHIQIKRQTERFGSVLDECERNTIVRKNGNVELRDLSEIDEAIKSLGVWIKDKKDNDEFERKFRIEFYESGVEIKNGFKVRDLVNILEIHIKPDTSTPEGLERLIKEDKSMEKCYNWLTSWCNIENIDQMLILLKVLKIEYSNTETALINETKEILTNIFLSEYLDQVHEKILSYTDHNSSFTSAIRPRHLLYLLKDYLQPDIPSWTQFQRDGSNWNISGIHDLENNNEIERPAVIVPALWSSENQNLRSLRIDGVCDNNCPISNSLMRLSLHPQGPFNIYCSDSSWKYFINNKTGGTLGAAKNDLNDSRIVEKLDPYSPSELKNLITMDEQEDTAKELHDEMYKITLKRIDIEMSKNIQNMPRGDFRTEVDSRWKAWKQTLEINVEEQRKLFSKLLHPKAEGESVSGELRVGLKTVDLLSEALLLLLIVSVCLGDIDNQKWESVKDKITMTAIGLAYWSGPADGFGEVIEIDDEIGIRKMLANEPGEIILIPQSKLSDNEVLNDDISGNILEVGLLTQPKIPKLLITKDPNFKRKIRNGDISVIKEYLQNRLKKYQKAITNAVNEVVA